MIRCESIHKSYLLGRTILPVLRGIDLQIEGGRFVAIIGASGSGKSTLLHVLSGLDVPQKGQVEFEGQPLFEPESCRQITSGEMDSALALSGRGKRGSLPDRPVTKGGDSRLPLQPHRDYRHLQNRRNELLNSAFGFVFQFYHLLPEFDVFENVMLPRAVGSTIGQWLASRRKDMENARALLDRVGLQARLHHRPNELSGGERQRAAIARALINRPKVLFADEPTGNLDAQTGRGIFALLKELNQSGQTILMVTHDRSLADQADQVVELVDGRVKSS